MLNVRPWSRREHGVLMRRGQPAVMIIGMDELLERLPRVYAQFLVLQREGQSDAVIAEQLGVPVESLPLVARLAAAKLARLQAEPDGRGDAEAGGA